MIYRVINTQTQELIYEYQADVPIEWHGMEFSTHDHVEYVPPVISQDGSIEVQAVRIWTPLEFLRRFTQAERVAIRDAAKASTVIEDYLKILEITTEVRSDDPDVSASLSLLEQNGLIAAGRAQEVLHG